MIWLLAPFNGITVFDFTGKDETKTKIGVERVPALKRKNNTCLHRKNIPLGYENTT